MRQVTHGIIQTPWTQYDDIFQSYFVTCLYFYEIYIFHFLFQKEGYTSYFKDEIVWWWCLTIYFFNIYIYIPKNDQNWLLHCVI